MKIRGNTVGTTLKPEAVLTKPKAMTEEQKAQVRENIGAAPRGDCFNDVMIAAGDGILMHYAGEAQADREGWYRIAKLSTKTVATFCFNTSNAAIVSKGIFTVIGCRVGSRDDFKGEPVITQIAYKRDIPKTGAVPADCGINKIRIVYGCTDENPVRPEEAEVMYLEVYRHKNGGNAIYVKAVGSTIEIPETDAEVPSIVFYDETTSYFPAGEVPDGAKVKEFVFKENALVADAIYVGDNKVLDERDLAGYAREEAVEAVTAGIETAGRSVFQAYTTGGVKALLLGCHDNGGEDLAGIAYKNVNLFYKPSTGELHTPKVVAETDIKVGNNSVYHDGNTDSVSTEEVDKMLNGAYGTGKTVGGVWQFTLGRYILDTPTLSQNINFTSNGKKYDKISWICDTSTDEDGEVLIDENYINYFYGDTPDYVYCWSMSGWEEGWETVDFGATPQPVTDDFYNWFTANATQISAPADKFKVASDTSLNYLVQQLKAYIDEKLNPTT